MQIHYKNQTRINKNVGHAVHKCFCFLHLSIYAIIHINNFTVLSLSLSNQITYRSLYDSYLSPRVIKKLNYCFHALNKNGSLVSKRRKIRWGTSPQEILLRWPLLTNPIHRLRNHHTVLGTTTVGRYTKTVAPPPPRFWPFRYMAMELSGKATLSFLSSLRARPCLLRWLLFLRQEPVRDFSGVVHGKAYGEARGREIQCRWDKLRRVCGV